MRVRVCARARACLCGVYECVRVSMCGVYDYFCVYKIVLFILLKLAHILVISKYETLIKFFKEMCT